MGFIESDIEAVLKGELEGVITDFPVYAVTQSEAAEERKRTYVLIKASPRKRRTQNNPTCDLQVEISCQAVADEGRGDTDLLLMLVEPVVTQLEAWEQDIDTACSTLSVDTFRVDGFSFDGGEPAGFDSGLDVWFQTYTITLSGVIQAPD